MGIGNSVPWDRREGIGGPAWPVLVAVALCFVATGFAGLVYEIIWNRTLTLRMGNTSYALAALLTVFMGGLALGAWLGGKWCARAKAPLRIYALIEIGVGIYCWLLPELLDLTDPIFAAIYHQHYDSLWQFSVLQLLLAGGLLLLPTTLMGATLPLLTQFTVRRLGELSRTVGWLYAINAGGAGAGALIAGFWLLPTIGVEKAYWVGVALNLTAGAVALALSYLPGLRSATAARAEAPERAEEQPSLQPGAELAMSRPVLLWAFGVSGFTAMVYQVAWTRAISVTIGSYTYAFSLTAGAFIFGLTLGSVALGWMGDRRWGRLTLGILPMVIALAAVLTVATLAELPVATARRLAAATSFAHVQWAQFVTVFFMMLIPTMCMGGLLPIVSRSVTRHQRDAGRSVGVAYSANAVGTILGSFFGGFVFVPWLGMRLSILAGAALSTLVGLVFLWQALRGRPRLWLGWGTGAVAAVAVAVILAPQWNQTIVASGPYINFKAFAGPSWSAAEIRRMLGSPKLVYYNEGVSSLVTVMDMGAGRKALLVDGRSEAGTRGVTQMWLGHLPMLVRPRSREVLVIGLGSGETAAAVATHPSVEHVEVVEIAEEVAEAARLHFPEAAGKLFADPRVKLVIGDGRLHLKYTDKTYDLIVSQPSTPWVAGAAALFTHESFELMKSRLKPGGLACIWFQGFHIAPEHVRVLSATWAPLWAHTSVWLSPEQGNMILLGSDDAQSVCLQRLNERLAVPAVAESLSSMHVRTAADVMSFLIVADEGVRTLGRGSIINTDANSRLEFDIPPTLWQTRTADIMRLLTEVGTEPWNHLTSENGQEQLTSIRHECERATQIRRELAAP